MVVTTLIKYRSRWHRFPPELLGGLMIQGTTPHSKRRIYALLYACELIFAWQHKGTITGRAFCLIEGINGTEASLQKASLVDRRPQHTAASSVETPIAV